MMANAGLKVTSMSGLDPFSEAQGVMRNLTGIGAAVNTALGYGKGALDTLRSDKASGDGKNPTLTEADLNRAEADFDKTDAQRMPAHKYDDYGIRRDGINPLTHSGYWEEEQ